MRVPSGFVSAAQWLRDRGLLYYRCARVVRCDTLEVPAADPEVEVDVREASDEDLRLLAPLENNIATDWLERKAQGSVCLVALSGSAHQGYQWITRSAEEMTEVSHVIDVSRDAWGAYLFDSYVLPSFRGKGVFRTLVRSSKRWALQQGLSRLYAAFARDNHISEHAFRKAGFVTIVGDVVLFRLLNREWKRVRHPHGMPIVDVLRDEGLHRLVPRAAGYPP